MAVEIGEIVAKLRADVADFERGMKKAKDELDSFSADTTKHVDAVKSKFEEIGPRLATQIGTAMTAMAAAIGGAMFQVSRQAGAAAEQMEHVSARSGLAVSTLEAWMPLLNRTGTSIDAFSIATRKMSSAIEKARGSQEAFDKSKFAEIGLKITDLGNMEKVYRAIAEAVKNAQDPAERARIVLDLLGRSGLNLIPAFARGAAAFDESAKQAKEWGLALDEATRTNLKDFDDSLDDLSTRLAGVQNALAATAAPAFKPLIDALGEAITWFANLSEGTRSFVLYATAALGAGGVFLTTVGALATLTGIALAPLMIGGAVIVALIAATAAIIQNWEKVKGFFASASEIIKAVVTSMMNTVYDMTVGKMLAIATAVKKPIDAVTGFFKGMYDKVVRKSYVPDMIEGIRDEFSKLDAFMVQPSAGAVGEVNRIFSGLSGGSVSISGGNIAQAQADLSALGNQVESLDIRISSAARTATAATAQVIKTGAFTWNAAMSEFASVATQTWGSITSTVSGALAQQLISGNDWAATMKSLATSILSAFINMILQMMTQWALATAFGNTQNSVQLASHTAMEKAKTEASLAGDSVRTISMFAVHKASLIAASVSLETLAQLGTVAGGILASLGSALVAVLSAAAVGYALTGNEPAAGAAIVAATTLGIAVGTLTAAMAASVVAAHKASIAAGAAAAVPVLGSGGIVTDPTTAIVGEAGPEAVIPLDRLPGLIGGSQIIYVMLDGRVLTRQVVRGMPRELRLHGVAT